MSIISFFYSHFAVIFVPAIVAVIAIYASFAEWLLHKYVMHQPFSIFGIIKLLYAYNAHARTHHVIFGHDESYHLQREEDKETIPMAWWNWLLLVPLFSFPIVALGFCAVHSWAIGLIGVIVFSLYYAAYESLHWQMHLPDSHLLGFLKEWRLFKFLDRHHNLHHRHMGKNYNVVFPAADWYWGTLIVEPIQRVVVKPSEALAA